jgi:predicted O-methyltransferase YrrM
MPVRDLKLKELSDSYFKPLDDDLAFLRRSEEESEVPLIMTETESLLRLLLDLRKPERILELGTAHGYSALFFARKCPYASVTTIDRNPAMIEEAVLNFASRPEGSRIDFRTGDAYEILESIASDLQDKDDSKKFDFVFIDAGKSHYKEFFEISEKICTQDAVIVCDNILMKGWIVEPVGKDAKRHRTNIKYMRQFLDYINKREDLDVTILTGGDGLAIIRFKNNGLQ